MDPSLDYAIQEWFKQRCYNAPVPPRSDVQAVRKLRQHWLFLLLVAVALLFSGSSLFEIAWGQTQAQHWTILALLVLAFQLAALWIDLPKNLPHGKRNLLPHFGAGTWLSLVRLLCISFMAGFLGLQLPPGEFIWIPFILNLIANFSDLLDGYVARVFGSVTILGQKLDMDLDGRGMLVATTLAFQYGQVAWWFLLVGLARYIHVFALWLRLRRGLPIEKLQPSRARRALAGTQMVFATAVLAPFFSPPETTFASALFMVPFLGHFIYDWLQITGRRKTITTIKAWVSGPLPGVFMPLAFRTLIALTLIWRVISSADAPLFLAAELLLAFGLGLGCSGRVAAALVLIETGFRLQGQPVQLTDGLILLASTAILYLGTGPHSVWKPEDHWIAHRPGEKKKA